MVICPTQGFFGAYGETLKGIALVAKQTVVRDDGEIQVLGYSLTEAGRQYGVPIVEHVLKWVVDNDLSMYQILGSTVTNGKTRSPENRIEILEALSTGKASESELSDFLDLGSGCVRTHLRNLSQIGFVKFDSVGAKSKGFSKYTLVEGKNPENVETVGKGTHSCFVTLTRKVAQEMSKGREFDRNSLSKIIEHKDTSDVSSVLSGLERQGFVRRTSPYQTNVVMSEARILESGERFLEEVIYPVKEHLSDSSVLETDFGERDSEYVSKGIDIYRKISPHINKMPSSERIQQIMDYLLRNPGATSKEIADSLNFTFHSATSYLGKMDLRTEKKENEFRYFLDNGNE